MAGSTLDSAAHLQVTWGNAISAVGSVSCCYDDPPTALRDAFNQELLRSLWNNTRIAVSWHLPHAETQRRNAERAAHPSWITGCACSGPRCLLVARHRQEEADELATASAAASLPLVPGDGTLLARLPRPPGSGSAWKPSPEILAKPRRSAIVLVAWQLDKSRVDGFAAMLGSDLDGAVTIQGQGTSSAGHRMPSGNTATHSTPVTRQAPPRSRSSRTAHGQHH
jgi:hypothetical protein